MLIVSLTMATVVAMMMTIIAVMVIVMLMMVIFVISLFRGRIQLVVRQSVLLALLARPVQTHVPIKASLVYQENIQLDHRR